LSQNNILCKRDEDRMKAVSQKVKKAAQASVLGQKFCNMTSRLRVDRTACLFTWVD
jgi:hypothetical protein